MLKIREIDVKKNDNGKIIVYKSKIGYLANDKRKAMFDEIPFFPTQGKIRVGVYKEEYECSDTKLQPFYECPFYDSNWCVAYNRRGCHQVTTDNSRHTNYINPPCHIWVLLMSNLDLLNLPTFEFLKILKRLPIQDEIALSYYGSIISLDFYQKHILKIEQP